jgi:hypothetical protein
MSESNQQMACKGLMGQVINYFFSSLILHFKMKAEYFLHHSVGIEQDWSMGHLAFNSI